MPKCFLCKKESNDIKSLIKHFKLQHLNHQFNFYRCIEGEYSRSFYLKNVFRKHLSKHCNNLTDLILPSTSHPIIESSADLDLIFNINISDSVTLNEVECKQFIAPDKILNQTIVKFLSCLYANPIIPRNTVQIVVDGIETVFSEGIAVCIESYIDQMISEGQISVESLSIFNNIIKIIKDTLVNFKTEHKRFSNFATQGIFVEPEEKIIGQRLNSVKKMA